MTCRWSLLMLLLVAIGACIPDELEYEYAWFDPEKLAFGSKKPLSELFLGDWRHICIAIPGEKPIRVVQEFAPQYMLEAWINDGRLYDSDFTTSLFKIVLLSDHGFKIYMMAHRNAQFDARKCYEFNNKFLNVSRSSVSSSDNRRNLRIE